MYFELSEQHLNVVLEGLAAMPLSKSFDAFVSIRNQMVKQREPMPTTMTPPPAHKANGVDDDAGR